MKNYFPFTKMIVMALYAFTFSFLTLQTYNSFAQSGEKWSFGCNSPSGNYGFGTNNASAIIFKTNGTSQMWLSPTGNLGLGISNPTHKFEVVGNSLFNGDINITGALNFNGTGGMQMASIVVPMIKTSRITPLDGDTVISIGDSTTGEVKVNGILSVGHTIKINGNLPPDPQGVLPNRDEITTSKGALCFGKENDFGEVKIGVGTGGAFQPRTKLHIHGTDSNPAVIRLESLFSIFGSTKLYAWDIAQVGPLGAGPCLAFQFGSKSWFYGYANNSLSTVTKMIITNNGDVGIGTEAPGAKLDVIGTAIFSDKVGIGNVNPLQKLDVTGSAIISGNVGIGLTAPTEALHIQSGNVYINAENTGLIIDEGANQRVGFMKYYGKQAGLWRVPSQSFEIGRVTGTLKAATAFTTDLFISGAGNVGIGTTTPGNYKLAVEGAFAARSVKVTLLGFVDYVFEENYKLMDLDTLALFLKINKHIPEIPTEREVITQGLDLGEFNTLLLKKLEEAYLYIIQLDNRINKLETGNSK